MSGPSGLMTSGWICDPFSVDLIVCPTGDLVAVLGDAPELRGTLVDQTPLTAQVATEGVLAATVETTQAQLRGTVVQQGAIRATLTRQDLTGTVKDC